MFYSDTNVKSLNQVLNNELIKVTEWLQANKLTLNIKKTQVILFKAKSKKIKEPLTLRINGEEIKQVSSTKFLGINIDSKLNWTQHIAYIQNKIPKIRNSLQNKTLCLIKSIKNALLCTNLPLSPLWKYNLGKYVSIKFRSINKVTEANY